MTAKMETYWIESNGKRYTFEVIKNTTAPCPQCGVPACGKENIIWYEYKNKKIAIIFDGGYLDLALEEFADKYFKLVKHNTLPEFVREWSECRGWTDCDDYEGYVLKIDDFLSTLKLLRLCEIGKWITEEEINDFENLALQAKKLETDLKIVCG